MDKENGSRNSIQSYLVSLTSEYRLLKELQSRSETQITDTNQKSEKLTSVVSTLSEHYKAYYQTLADAVDKLNNMYIQIEKIKDQLNTINIRLEQVDGQRARCGDRFTEMTGRVEDIDGDIKELSVSVDALSKKLQSIIMFVKNNLVNKLNNVDEKLTKDFPATLDKYSNEQEELAERIKILEETHIEVKAGFKHLKIYGGICVGIVTILASLKTLGWI